MKKQHVDKSRLEDLRRKRVILLAAAVIIVLTVLLCIGLSHMAVRNVDTEEGVAAIRALEKTDTAPIEAQISQIEKKERQAQEDWKNRPLSEKFANAVVFGDSIAQGFQDYEILDSSRVVSEIGVVMTEIEPLVEEVEQLNPQVLFLALGHNDISNTDGDIQAFVEQYRQMCEDFKRRLPNMKIYAVKLLPVQEHALEKYPEYADIDKYNEALEQLCGEEQIPLLDASGLIKEEYYDEDGEHMVSEFYPVWGEYMAEEAGI